MLKYSLIFSKRLIKKKDFHLFFIFFISFYISVFSQICGFDKEEDDIQIRLVEMMCDGFIVPENKFNYDINYEPVQNPANNEDYRRNLQHNSAKFIVRKIVESYGVRGRFILQPCEKINNAYADTKNGIRYILFDPEFIKEISYGFGAFAKKENINNNTYVNLFILSHEIAHHIEGHTLNPNQYINYNDKKNIELEADKWAGFVMERLGLTLEQASLAIKLKINDFDDTYSNYPNKKKRLLAVEEGYNNSIAQKSDFQLKNNHRNYFNEANQKYFEEDYYGAIEYYTLAINLVTKSLELSEIGYGENKINIKANAQRGISLNNDFLVKYYVARARSWFKLKNYDKALDELEYLEENNLSSTSISLLKGEIYYSKKNYIEAIDEFFNSSIWVDGAIDLMKESGTSRSPFDLYVTYPQALNFKTHIDLYLAESYYYVNENDYQKHLDKVQEESDYKVWRATAKERSFNKLKEIIDFTENFYENYPEKDENNNDIDFIKERFGSIPMYYVYEYVKSYDMILEYLNFIGDIKSFEKYYNKIILFIDKNIQLINTNKNFEYLLDFKLSFLNLNLTQLVQNKDLVDEAINLSIEIIEQFPESYYNYSLLIQLLIEKDEKIRALDYINKFIEVSETNYKSMKTDEYHKSWYAESLQQKGYYYHFIDYNYEKSIINYNSAIELIKDNNTYFRRINLNLSEKKYYEALKDLDYIQSVNKDDPDIFYKKAYVFENLNENFKALENITLAIQKKIENPNDYYIENIDGEILDLSDLYFFRSKINNEVNNVSGYCSDLELCKNLLNKSDDLYITINKLIRRNCKN